jgi:flagellar hook-basal body complex protein FliE
MADFKIDGIGPLRYTPLGTPAAKPSVGPDFREALTAAIGDVNELQLDVGAQTNRLIAGEPIDLHEVMISAEEASVAFDLMMEIRNKLLEAYQEIQRMQI